MSNLIIPDADVAKTLVKGITPYARLQFPHLLTPSSFGDEAKKTYSAYLVFDAEHAATMNEIASAAAALSKPSFPFEKVGKSKAVIWPIKDCEEMEQYGGFHKGKFFIKFATNASDNFPRPPIFDQDNVPIEDVAKVCGGAAARINYFAKAWSYGGRQGISFYINATQIDTDTPVEHVGGGAKSVEELALAFKEAPDPTADIARLRQQTQAITDKSKETNLAPGSVATPE